VQSHLCASAPVQQAWLEVDTLLRRPGLIAREFRELEAQSEPVIVASGAAFAAAARRWSLAYLAEKLAGKDIAAGVITLA
jgi:hypothetical protein